MRRLVVILLLAATLPACELPVTGPAAVPPPGGGGVATASVITVVPAVTSVPGSTTGGTAVAPPTAAPPTPLPTLASASLTPSELKYRLLDRFPDFFFCDPDYYPVARDDEALVAVERFPELQTNQEEFHAIVEQLGLAGTTSFSDQQMLVIYREHKKLAALPFEVVGGQYHFQITTGGAGSDSQNIQGVIDGSGRITVQSKTPGFATCPICLAAHTLIDTPRGAIPVEQIRVGESVWTVNESGERAAAPVLKVARVPVSAGHMLIHEKRDDGRELWASPGHPTADGRVLAQLRTGELLDEGRIVLAQAISYGGSATYDLLPAGPTGFYWADGILMGSTLHP